MEAADPLEFRDAQRPTGQGQRCGKSAIPARDVVGGRPGTRQRTRYVTSLKELSDDERLVVKALEEVMRRPHPGTPRQRMVKLTLHSERDAAKLLRLRDEVLRAAATVGCWV